MGQRFHYYHADANALGGSIHRPLKKVIPAQASVSLPAAGGFSSAHTGAFHFEDLVSCRASSCRVSGSEDEGGHATTQVTSVIEGLNLLDMVTAERVVSQIATERPPDGHSPTVTFVGSQFIGLRIAGFEVEPIINLKLLTPPYDGPKSPWLKNDKLLQSVRDQHTLRTSGEHGKPEWLTHRYGWVHSKEDVAEQGHVVCSLVEGFTGTIPGKTYGHIVEIAGIGKFFFGEVSFYDHLYRLTMVRAEIGSPTGGSISGGTTGSNGGSTGGP
jgi:hypothetical protein